MNRLNPDDLEKAISNAKETKKNETSSLSKEEEIGFHKGSLNTLIAERNELVKMAQNVEKIMSAHIERLKELGVNLK